MVKRTHGMSGTRLYRIWKNMRNRCYNPNYPKFEGWGGRGITVCGEWRDNFKAFYDWAIEHGYSDDRSIDRIDNDEGYCPENCRWATPLEQANNSRKNRFITYRDETKTLSNWARATGISKQTIFKRINLYGWSVEQALTTPSYQKRRNTCPHY